MSSLLSWFKVKLLHKAQERPPRTVFIREEERNAPSKFSSNYITTSKYTLLSFPFKNIAEQFSRLANFYFLLISALQLIPGLSPTGRYTTLVPLILVMFASALKEAYEDIKRHKQDNEVNNSKTHVLRQGGFQRIKWRDVKTGDIVKVNNREFFPADLILLSSSDPLGICFIETSQLDGETNLKMKQSLEETAGIQSDEDLLAMRGQVKCEGPNNRLHRFEGSLAMRTGDEREMPLEPRQVLLRGACLRNTKHIVGIAIYTGPETKLMMNQRAAPHKRSNVEVMTNASIVFLFCIEITMAVICTIGSAVWMNRSSKSHWYLDLGDKNLSKQAGLNFLTFVILFNNLIPISLYVSVEFVRLMQAYFINSDDTMVHKNVYGLARTSNLNDELGQVQYIFSDKTGTLTQNIMQFRKCSIAGTSYGKGTSEIMQQAARAKGEVVEDMSRDQGMSSLIEDDFVNFNDPKLFENMRNPETCDVIREFMTTLAVCHTIIPEPDPDDPSKIIYQASSPDENALVGAAKAFGYEFVSRTPKSVTIKINGLEKSYELLNTLEFNSTRKRMSVIVRNDEGKIILYCKGADTVIYQRLSPNQPYADTTIDHLRDFANDGLRTLCLAVAVLDPSEYAEWARIQEAASTSIGNREAELMKAAELIEKNLFLLGATAIEDKLQDGVPDTINTLLEANIKVWMLTGDKQETAINIGFACRLLTKEMQLMVLNEETQDGTGESLDKWIADKNEEGKPLALVIDSTTLDFALSEALKIKLLTLAKRCMAVVCCRCTPLQKAQVVQLVKQNVAAITLAIGDGANDVSMIQSAHVGVGISGEEGLQAARSSDYAIAQFRFLRRLLFIHGRYSYRRTSLLILYSFYKNIALYLTQFWFTFVNGFSGQSLYDRWTLAVYNILFTFVPIIIFGCFDKDIPEKAIDAIPKLFCLGQRKEVFNYRTFWGWAINALYHSFLAFIIPYAAHQHSLTFYDGVGWNDDLYSFGLTVYTIIIITTAIRLFMETHYWTWINHLVYWGCLTLYVLWMLIYGQFWPAHLGVGENMYWLFYYMFIAPTYWWLIIFTPVLALSRDFIWKYLSNTYWPSPAIIAREIFRYNGGSEFGVKGVEEANGTAISGGAILASSSGIPLEDQASTSPSSSPEPVPPSTDGQLSGNIVV